MERIIVSSDDMWNYFQTNKEELKTTEHIVAENDEFGIIISLTEEDGFPCFIVTADEYQHAEEVAISEKDCKETITTLYENYLSKKFITELLGEDSLEDKMYERELELDDAVISFLDIAIEDDSAAFLGLEADAICEDIKDHLLEYIYRKHGLSCRRPMFLEDEDTGEDFYEEYPYEHMLFEDEDNPLYSN